MTEKVVHTGLDGFEDTKTSVSITVAGTRIKILRRDLEDEDFVDVNFFDPDYTLAGSTGFSVWEGARHASALLRREPNGVFAQALRGRRVLELGAGTGLGGLAAAAVGAHVMLTDLQSVLEGSVALNIEENAGEASAGGWPGARTFGTGSICGGALDWTKPIHGQAPSGVEYLDCEVVLAVECVWLNELVQPFIATVLALLAVPSHKPDTCVPAKRCLMVTRNRAKADSKHFASLRHVVEEMKSRGCLVDILFEEPSTEVGHENVMIFDVRLATTE